MQKNLIFHIDPFTPSKRLNINTLTFEHSEFSFDFFQLHISVLLIFLLFYSRCNYAYSTVKICKYRSSYTFINYNLFTIPSVQLMWPLCWEISFRSALLTTGHLPWYILNICPTWFCTFSFTLCFFFFYFLNNKIKIMPLYKFTLMMLCKCSFNICFN